MGVELPERAECSIRRSPRGSAEAEALRKPPLSERVGVHLALPAGIAVGAGETEVKPAVPLHQAAAARSRCQ